MVRARPPRRVMLAEASSGSNPDKPTQKSPFKGILILVDLARIELAFQQCECRVLPLYDKPNNKNDTFYNTICPY